MANEAGKGCAARNANISGYTFVSAGFPASISGSVDRLAMYGNPDNAADTFTFAFFTAAGNTLTPVAGTTQVMTVPSTGLGCKEFNAPGDFTAFSVTANTDYLGCYAADVQHYENTGAEGMWYLSGDQTGGAAFSYNAGYGDALTADITAAGGISIPVAMYHYRSQQ